MAPKTTIGVDFATRDLELDDKILKCQIWDTAGQESFRSLTSAYYRNAHGVIIVYDITKRHTFKNLNNWLHEVLLYAPQNSVIMVLGNKLDLDHVRTVSTEEAQDWANKFLFLETSALDASNVELAFCELVRVIYERKDDLPSNFIKILPVIKPKKCIC